MREYSIKSKLLASFIVVVFIAAIIGVFGMIKIKQIAQLDSQLFTSGAKPLADISLYSTAYQRTRVNLRNVLLASFNEQDETKYIERLAELDAEMDGYAKEYQKTLVTNEGKKNFAALMESIKKFTLVRGSIVELAQSGQTKKASILMNGEGAVITKEIDDNLKKMTADKIGFSLRLANANTATAHSAIIITIAVTLFGAAIAFLLGFFLTRSITRPVNKVVAGLSEGSDQVASASGQVSAASQSLAEGASEQASALEETSASIEQLSSMTLTNAENASQANTLMAETGRVVNEANQSMQALTGAMQEITSGSEDMAKIIKTIDEIAFQTNLLALNAAVEAARAGEAGAGFAVVAGEVRNLAMRSADSAKNTARLIDDSIKRIKNGSEIVSKTNEAFERVLTGAKKVGELVGEIAAASNEQAQGISQISKAVAEMDKVIQQNAANAEESASASEELNAQAMQMKEFVADMITVVQGSSASVKTERRRRTALSVGTGGKAATSHSLSSNSREAAAPGAGIVRREQAIPMDAGDEFKDF
jgi:methyl-accepting chemotaxis protein